MKKNNCLLQPALKSTAPSLWAGKRQQGSCEGQRDLHWSSRQPAAQNAIYIL